MATVLALDGDEVSLLSLQDILESFGHTLVPAAKVETARREVARRTFDLVLVDIGLADLDAAALIGQWTKDQPELRIVALTATPKAQAAADVLAAGAHSLMKKPYEVGRILHLVEERRP